MPEPSKTRLLFLALAVLVAAAAYQWRSSARSSGQAEAAVGAPAPAFKLADIGGKTVSLSDYKGKVVLVNFWASWCSSCQEEMPALKSLYEKHRAQGFVLLALSVDNGGRKDVLPFVARFEPTFPVLLCNPDTARSYGVFGLPASYLIGQDGLVYQKYVGPLTPRQVENDILKELNKRRPS